MRNGNEGKARSPELPYYFSSCMANDDREKEALLYLGLKTFLSVFGMTWWVFWTRGLFSAPVTEEMPV